MRRKAVAGIVFAIILFCSLILTNIGNDTRQNIADEKEPGVLSIAHIYV